MISALLPGSVLGAVGRIDFAIGDVTSLGRDGRERRVVKGSAVNEGDTIKTERGRAQIRFSDGGYTSLAPNTEFRIDDYQFEGENDQEARSFFSMLKGGLRTITGAVGKLRKKAYKLTTPVATIGIRGTEYVIVFEGDGLRISVGDGEIEVVTAAGTRVFRSGETGFVTASGAETTDDEASIPPPGQETDYSRGDERSDDGTNLAVAQPRLENGDIYALSTVFAFFDGEGALDVTQQSRGQLAEDEILVTGLFSNPLAAFAFPGGNQFVFPSGEGAIAGANTGQFVDTGEIDATVGWGRWTQAVVNADGDSADAQHLHYAIGVPTPDVPASGTATFAFAGGTRPTLIETGFEGGLAATGTISPSSNLVANFGANTVTANLFTSVAGNSYTTTAPLSMNEGAAGGNRHAFSGAGSFTLEAGGACSYGCATYVEGFFAGNQASHAGLTYKFQKQSFSNDYVMGAAAFKR